MTKIFHPAPEIATGCESAIRAVVKNAISVILENLPDAKIITAVSASCPIHGGRKETFAVSRGTSPAEALTLLRRTSDYIRGFFWTDQPLHPNLKRRLAAQRGCSTDGCRNATAPPATTAGARMGVHSGNFNRTRAVGVLGLPFRQRPLDEGSLPT
jgi:hypothetical protein